MKKDSPFRQPKALLMGAVFGLVAFGAVTVFYAIRGPEYAALPGQTSGGSVVVRPIVKDNSVKRATTAVLLGFVGFYFGVQFAGKRKIAKADGKTKDGGQGTA